MNAIDDRFARAETYLRAAGATALRYFHDRDALEIVRKGRQDWVSKADREVETQLRAAIGADFPDDLVFGEEHGGEIGDRCWVIDPIDGTRNFLSGAPYWCCTFAFVDEGRTQFGLIYDPVHDEMFAAREGAGARRDGAPIQASAKSDPAGSCVALSYAPAQDPAPYAEMTRRLFERGFDHRRMGSAALQLAHVADGRWDGAACQRINSWDVLAGLILVREAGGRATRFEEDWPLDRPRAAIGAAAALAPVLEEACFGPLNGAPSA